ncbi:MAG: branched-chain amino acid ABC transporter substrate-binding protein [Rhodospirillaceae bacterium]|nr:branched-chain amino acid ABC transporter substrate-binding protein [Rhodospirillaceae bacterium]
MNTISRRCLGVFAAAAFAVTAVTPVLAKDTVKIAFVGPLTGGTSSLGLGGRNSAELAVKLRNADGKSKYQYELVAQDDECKPNVGVQVVTKIAADRGVVGSVSHYCSAVAMGTLDIYHKFGLPMIVWGAVLPDITYSKDYPEIHRVNGTMINQNEVAAKAMTAMGYKTWAILHDTTDYGKGHNLYITKYLTENGARVLGTFGVTADQQDFTAELTKVKELNPEVVYFGGLTPIGVRIRQQMDKLGINAQYQGASGIVSEAYPNGTGALAEGTIAFLEGGPIEKLPGGQYFAAEYAKANYAQPADAYGPFAYAAAMLLIDAVEEVGPNRKKVTEYLAKIKDHDSIIGPITFDDHGQNSAPMITTYVVQDGKWTVWEDSEYASGKRHLVKK